MKWLFLLLLAGCADCEGAEPGEARFTCATEFQRFEAELPIDCAIVRGHIALAEMLGEALGGIPPGELAAVATTTQVHVRAVNFWWYHGPVEGMGGPRGLQVGRDTSSLLHEWLHRWEWTVRHIDDQEHRGWGANGFRRADEAFTRAVRR